MKSPLLAAFLALCAGAAQATPASANRASASLLVSATILDACSTTVTQARLSVACSGASVTTNATGSTTTTSMANVTTTTTTFPNEGGSGFYTVRTVTYDE